MDSTDKQSGSGFTVINEEGGPVCYSNSLLKLKNKSSQSSAHKKTEQSQKPQQQKPDIFSASSSKVEESNNVDEELSSKYADSVSSADPQPPPQPPTNNDKVNDAFSSGFTADNNSSSAVLREAYEAKLKQQETEWRQRVTALEEFTDRLMKQNSGKLAEEVGHLQQQHYPRKEVKAYTDPPCKLAEHSVKDCFAQNGVKQPLLCSKAVKAFADCVRLAAFDYIESTFSSHKEKH